MAEIRCSNCGQENPDFFDNCQFCQTPLKTDDLLHAGDAPSEKDTGELEPILPEWLQDARQQNRDSVEDNSVSPETKPRIQKNEPLDLLAGLSSQDDSDEDEVPDWLSSINPIGDDESSRPSLSSEKEEPSDFFAQFSQAESQLSTPAADEPDQNDMSSLFGGMEADSGQTDELSDWLSQTKPETSDPNAADQGQPASEDNSWMNNLGAPDTSMSEPPAEKVDEDLSWLHNLEAEAKKTGDLSTVNAESGFDVASARTESSEEDLSWLKNLGGTSAPESSVETSPSVPESSQEDLGWMRNLGDPSTPSIEESAPSQSESSKEDLSWLDNLGGTPISSTDESSQAQSESSEEDLGWLDSLGGTPVPTVDELAPAENESSQEDLSWMSNLGGTSESASDELAPVEPESSQDDLGWLDNLGGTPISSADESVIAQSESSQEDLGWMNNLGDDQSSQESVPRYTPRGTAPLSENAGQDSTPDWLKSAMEEPSMPAPGELSMDWFADHEKSTTSETISDAQEMPDLQSDESSASIVGEPASVSNDMDFPSSGSSAASSQDVDDLFNVDMSNWGSQETDKVEETPFSNPVISGEESLAPVDLPSWVQDMRPVDSAIADTSIYDASEEEAESEGPLAGFHGVIPSAPIGSSLRPKAFSLKLQVTDSQQAGAELIEQIIANETSVSSVSSTTVVASQRMLRWILSGLFIVVLGFVIGLGWHNLDIIAPGQVEVNQLSTMIGSVPDSSPVLLVMDYEPAVAGELAAAAGPVLDQLAVSRNSKFTFLAMSPNGSAMVEHLLWSTKISVPESDDPFDGGLGYQASEDYFNAGFLPGGSAGVLGFINDPVKMMPDVLSLATVGSFSNFEAVILLTDNAESGRVWVEQLEISKQYRPEIAFKPLIVISSAQAGPMLEPYVSSGQVDVLINGLFDAAKYEFVNQSQPGLARAYWDSFGIGLMMAILAIVFGSIWNIFMGIRERRAEAEQG